MAITAAVHDGAWVPRDEAERMAQSVQDDTVRLAFGVSKKREAEFASARADLQSQIAVLEERLCTARAAVDASRGDLVSMISSAKGHEASLHAFRTREAEFAARLRASELRAQEAEAQGTHLSAAIARLHQQLDAVRQEAAVAADSLEVRKLLDSGIGAPGVAAGGARASFRRGSSFRSESPLSSGLARGEAPHPWSGQASPFAGSHRANLLMTPSATRGSDAAAAASASCAPGVESPWPEADAALAAFEEELANADAAAALAWQPVATTGAAFELPPGRLTASLQPQGRRAALSPAAVAVVAAAAAPAWSP